jgi:hypothetical protein
LTHRTTGKKMLQSSSGSSIRDGFERGALRWGDL